MTDKPIFSILTEFITEWQISSEEDKERDYIADKSNIMNKALRAIHDYHTKAVLRARAEELDNVVNVLDDRITELTEEFRGMEG